MSNKNNWLVGKMGPGWRKKQITRLPPICAWCGAPEGLVLDHKLARALGGNNALSNLQLLCPPCALRKAVAENKATAEARRIAQQCFGGNLALVQWVIQWRCQGLAG